MSMLNCTCHQDHLSPGCSQFTYLERTQNPMGLQEGAGGEEGYWDRAISHVRPELTGAGYSAPLNGPLNLCAGASPAVGNT